MVLPTIGEQAKGVFQELEQLNIVGKRSGDGFVSHKGTMVNVLSRGLADRVLLMDFTIGRKGLLNYIRSLAGSNVVKIVPSANGSDSESHTADKRLKVVCGAFTTYLDDEAWITDKTGMSYAEIRVCQANTLTPNVGSTELADAISKVLPFTHKEDDRPILRCILFEVENGTLKLVSADGFRLATVDLDYEHDGEPVSILIDRDLLKGIPSALRKAKRVRVSFGHAGDNLTNRAVFIDTEIARYRFVGSDGTFPNYKATIPAEFDHHTQVDAAEFLKALLNLKASSADVKDYSVDLTLGDGQLVLAHPDNHANAVVKADAGDGVAEIRLNGGFVIDVMKAVGSGMVDFALSRAHKPIMFTADGFRAVLMPMMSPKANATQQAERDQATETEATAEATETEATAEATETEATAEATETEGKADTEADTEATAEATETEGKAEATAEATETEDTETPKRSRGRGRDRGRQRQPVAART